jgi:ABC-type dipeptide/oligopeptide/nickel transport system permease subunit
MNNQRREQSELKVELVAQQSIPPASESNVVFAMPSHLKERLPELPLSKPRSLWYYSWKRFKRNRLAFAGLIVTILLVVVAAGASLLGSFDPNMQILEYSTKPSGFKGNVILKVNDVNPGEPEYIPVNDYHVTGDKIVLNTIDGTTITLPLSALFGKTEAEWHQRPVYYLGTDGFGRDVLTRLMYGARVSLAVAFFSELLSLLIGVLFGALAGFYRGWVDEVIMWITNVVWSIPSLLLVIALSIALGVGLWQTIIAIGITGWVDMARIVRGQFFTLRETEYVEATKALGFGSMRAIFRHMLPNSLGPIIVISTAGFASAIIYEATLSFLGLGVQPPASSWGKMIYDGKGYIASDSNWGLTIYPCLAIMIAVFAFNLFGDGLRDAFDPKLKR